MARLKKNVLITGAAGNLGKATVERFYRDGYQVIATVEPGQKDTVENVSLYPVDLQDEMAADRFVTQVAQEFQSIDAALLLVGGFGGGDINATKGKDLKRMIALNFETAFYVARPVFRQMLAQPNGGRIVFIGARAALQPDMGRKFLAYSLSKAMLFNLADMLNAEGAGKNVVTSVVVPSTIDTPANRAAMPSADFAKWVRPEEIAEVMAFVSSASAKSLAGTVFKVYGSGA